jgi:hypothetical protein
MNTNTLISLASEHGLVFRGGFSVTPEDAVPLQVSGEFSETLLLFGQAGKSLWPVFSQSSELSDGQPHPLDRWSERVGQSIADKLNGRLLLPFGDAPHHPFIRWASRIEDVRPSRLGILIHPIHGLWHAYRFAIAIAEPVEGFATIETGGNICNQCQLQPCLNRCPVNAFDGTRYEVKTCFHYLQENPDSVCHTSGCQARGACPEGELSHYTVEQKQFHMTQFKLALEKRYIEGADS